MVELAGIFSRLKATKILVIGDFILDRYTIGKAQRISPEAPVPVVHVRQEEYRAGGAGNVALNLISMGAEVIPVGRIGIDSAAVHLRTIFVNEGASVAGLFVQEGYAISVKNRIIADGQQIVRIDTETIEPLPEMLEQRIIEALPALLVDVSVVAISDYGKGFLSRTLLASLIQQAKSLNIPVISDPKGLEFDKYSGSTVIKPNLSEAYAAANLPLDAHLNVVAAKVLQLSQAEMLMVTRSEAGISIFYKNGDREDYPVRIREVKDVTGAGDTVLAMLAYAVGNGLSIAEASQLSNLAAGVAIERFGCVRVALSDVARYLLTMDSRNKVFDSSHLFALQHAIKGRETALLCLSSHTGFTSEILGHIIKLGSRKEVDLIVYIQELNPPSDFLEMLAALNHVDFILLPVTTMEHVAKAISIHQFYTIENSELVETTIPFFMDAPNILQ